jgi:hypothetical protein
MRDSLYQRSALALLTALLIPWSTANGDLIVLDDYSDNSNFTSGNYTFLQLWNSPTNNPTVSGGRLRPNVNGARTGA